METTFFETLIEQALAYAARLHGGQVVEEHPHLGLTTVVDMARHFGLDEDDLATVRSLPQGEFVAVGTGTPPYVLDLRVLPLRTGDRLLAVRDVTAAFYRPHVWDRQGEGILAVDRRGFVYYANTAAGRLFGRAREHLVGSRLGEVRPELGSAFAALQDPRGFALDLDLPVRLSLPQDAVPGGGGTWAEFLPLMAHGRAGAALVLLHGGEASGAEHEEDVLRLTTAAVAHELRNPAQAVRGFLQLARARSEGEVREWLDVALREFQEMMGTLEEFLWAAKGERRELTQVDLLDVVRRALRRVMLRWPEAEGMVEVEGQAAPVVSDPASLVVILAKLIENAVEAEGATRVRVRLFPRGVEVRDDGHGVPPAAMGRLFEPFYTTKFQGSGLGLYLARRMAEAIDAAIEVRNEGGAVFTLRLPEPSTPEGLVPAAPAGAVEAARRPG